MPKIINNFALNFCK